MVVSLNLWDDLPKESLSKTDWNDFKEPIIDTLIPNFFITYFGQDLPHDNINDDEIKAKLVHLGTGYELWANTANNAVKKLDEILSVMEENQYSRIHQEALWPQPRCYVPPSGHIKRTLWCNDLSPVRWLSGCSQCHQGFIPTQSLGICSNSCFLCSEQCNAHLPAKADKESEAKKGIVKLMLFHIRGNIDIKATSVSNIISAIPSKRDAGGSEPASRSLCQSICRSCLNDIRVGQATRLHQHLIDSDFDLGHVKDPCVLHASREFCNQEGYQSWTQGQFSGTIRFSSTEE